MTQGVLPFKYEEEPKTSGWTDKQIVLALMLLNLSGGDCCVVALRA